MRFFNLIFFFFFFRFLALLWFSDGWERKLGEVWENLIGFFVLVSVIFLHYMLLVHISSDFWSKIVNLVYDLVIFSLSCNDTFMDHFAPHYK